MTWAYHVCRIGGGACLFTAGNALGHHDWGAFLVFVAGAILFRILE